MVFDDLMELKIVIRCVLVSCIEALTIEELWNKIEIIFGPNYINLTIFGYNSVFEFLQSIPDVVQVLEILFAKVIYKNFVNVPLILYYIIY